MKTLVTLPFLFRVVAFVELTYAALALLTPTSMITPITGWVLNADGYWITRLMGVSLGTQAIIAWTFRDDLHSGLAKVLAFYQFGSATVDWVMWLLLKDQGIFSTELAKVTVAAAIVSHYLIGLLLVVAIWRQGAKS